MGLCQDVILVVHLLVVIEEVGVEVHLLDTIEVLITETGEIIEEMIEVGVIDIPLGIEMIIEGIEYVVLEIEMITGGIDIHEMILLLIVGMEDKEIVGIGMIGIVI